MARQLEEAEQTAVFTWARYQQARWPELKLLHHIPNGGKRDAVTAAKLKAAGVKAGVPDICLPVPRCGYHGLYIELKQGKNRTTPAQDDWLQALKDNGYAALVCYGHEECAAAIIGYLSGGNDEN